MNRVSPNRGNRRWCCAKLIRDEAVTSEKVRVVVGDDHPMFRDGVVRALMSSGSIDVVAEADDGVTALAAIREHQPQVALLDYRMPGMDGAEVAAAVTATNCRPGCCWSRRTTSRRSSTTRCRRVRPDSCPRSRPEANW